jgi:hypothetical protein
MPKGMHAVSIVRFPPDWFIGLCCQPLAPSRVAFKLTGEAFDAAFAIQLRKLDAAKLWTDIGGDDALLLCYESPVDGQDNELPSYCHRRNVALWFEQELEVVVPELVISKK